MFTVQGTRMFLRCHADECEEDKPERRPEYSDEYIKLVVNKSNNLTFPRKIAQH